jgi:hypothetical protein
LRLFTGLFSPLVGRNFELSESPVIMSAEGLSYQKEKNMAKRWSLIIGLCLMLVPLSILMAVQETTPAGKPQTKSLKVTVSYKGKGKVDQSHGVYLFLFDTPDFVQNPSSAMPIAFQTLRANDESVVFSGLVATTVYLVAAFDDKGTYDISAGAPPTGTPVALYKPGDPQTPTPIKLEENKELEIKFEFDDSIRMP